MPLFNKKELTPEEQAVKEQAEAEKQAQKARAEAEKQAQKAADKERKQHEAFLKTPVGLARGAFEQGDHLFQVDFDVKSTKASVVAMTGAFSTSKSNDVSDVLNEICREGWEIQSASMVFHETGSESRDKFLASGQQIAVKGDVIGYYVFKRCEANRVTDRPFVEAV